MARSSHKKSPTVMKSARHATLPLREQEFQLLILASWPQCCIGGISLGYEVPIIAASGLGKQYLVPGWRLGWIVCQDNKCGSISNVKKGAQQLAQVIIGACHLAQFAIPAVLDPKYDHDCISTATWKAKLHCIIERQAGLLC
jgi:hypothetical protein